MTVKSYVARVLKYFFKLLIMVALLYALLFVMRGSRLGMEQAFAELFSTMRGYGMLGMLFIISLAFPAYGFVTRKVEGDIETDRDVLLEVFYKGDYSLERETPGNEMVFRAFSLAKRIWLMGDDRIIVRQSEGGLTISGIRKDVVHVEFRLKTYLDASRGDESGH